MVLAIVFMTRSKRLAVATADRRISFYELNNGQKFVLNTVSRIEGLLGVPLCMEYYHWKTTSYIDEEIVIEEKECADEKAPDRVKKETLLVGDDLGIVIKYDFTMENWHWCHFNNEDAKPSKGMYKNSAISDYCCNHELEADYQRRLNREVEAQREAKKERDKQMRALERKKFTNDQHEE